MRFSRIGRDASISINTIAGIYIILLILSSPHKSDRMKAQAERALIAQPRKPLCAYRLGTTFRGILSDRYQKKCPAKHRASNERYKERN
ncbi:hypothetical protein AB0758_49355 [Tolypothrix bouteillei VB521301_2]|uniref:hypothetical protein n=1 Tax=Tolypothrix bouteillei TaxID=1246981 RepID=UPI0038B51D13